MNPVARVLAGLLAVLALIGAFFFGLFVLAVAIGLAVLAWLIITLRMWWLQRSWSRQAPRGETGGPGGARKSDNDEGAVIEADYEVISRREDE
jgi:hypothetical protein